MFYYPHIDGLRAIAILLVLFFHGGLAAFPSGFIGVDVFFVISGFLITGIITNALNQHNFSFVRFYTRRLWRLQPVFLCLLVCTTLITLIYYLPDDLMQYGKSLRKTSLYLSNNFFSNATAGYFAPDGKEFPLLHTWSLSIEWQCYFILPLLLYVLYRVFNKDKLPQVIYLLTIISLIWSFYPHSIETTKSYYFLSNRVFEFLFGSCIALSNKAWKIPDHFVNLITILALSSLLYIATTEGVSLNFPNGYALIVCLATATLIKLGSQSSAIVVRMLTTKFMVRIGLISYSLYIWHWPIFALNHYMGFSETKVFTILAFIFTFAIAYCSWRFIEKPARHYSNIKPVYTCIFLLVLPILLTHVIAYEIKRYEGFPLRFNSNTSVFTELKKYQSDQRAACLVFKDTEVSQECVLGNKKATKHALMIGDSFSNHYWRFIELFAQGADLSVLAQATGSCLVLPGISQRFLNTSRLYTECQQQTDRYFEMIKKNHYNYVIIGESWNGYFSNIIVNQSNNDFSAQPAAEQLEHALDNALKVIIESGSQPVLIKDIALSPKGNPYQCVLNHIKKRRGYSPEECNYTISSKYQQRINKLFAKMKQKYSQLIVIDPQRILCDKNHCKADINHIPVFRDSAHLTDYASYQLGRLYLKKYQNPFS